MSKEVGARVLGSSQSFPIPHTFFALGPQGLKRERDRRCNEMLKCHTLSYHACQILFFFFVFYQTLLPRKARKSNPVGNQGKKRCMAK